MNLNGFQIRKGSVDAIERYVQEFGNVSAGGAGKLSINSQSWRRACGSRPVVGSSRNRKSGSPTSAQAIASRCFCPPERFAHARIRASPELHQADTSAGVGPAW